VTDFLLELRCEEIPARMQAGARAELEKLFRRELEAAGVTAGDVTVWSTPRRLALIARGLPDATEAVSEEAKGPPEGAPEAALEGFCRKSGVTKDQLQLREVKGRQTWFADEGPAVRGDPCDRTRLRLAQVDALGRGFAQHRKPALGQALERHCCDIG
jgi:glycyl-tRNA synthetase beta subunit